MKVLIFAASLREESLNKKLAKKIEELTFDLGKVADLALFSDFEVPLYNGDLDDGKNWPKGVSLFHERMTFADAMVIVSPEYNYSIPGPLKNLIDWVSRLRPIPWKGTKIFLASASPSRFGGAKGLTQLKVPLDGMGAFVYPEMMSVGEAHRQLDENGNFVSSQLEDQLRGQLEGFFQYVERLS